MPADEPIDGEVIPPERAIALGEPRGADGRARNPGSGTRGPEHARDVTGGTTTWDERREVPNFTLRDFEAVPPDQEERDAVALAKYAGLTDQKIAQLVNMNIIDLDRHFHRELALGKEQIIVQMAKRHLDIVRATTDTKPIEYILSRRARDVWGSDARDTPTIEAEAAAMERKRLAAEVYELLRAQQKVEDKT